MIIKAKWSGLILIQYLIGLLAIVLIDNKIFSSLTSGIMCITIALIVALYSLRNNKLFTPITASIIFDISFALYIMKLVTSYTDMKIGYMVCIVTCSFIWKFITVASYGFNHHTKNRKIEQLKLSRSSFVIIVTFLFIVSAAAMMFEWAHTGGIPILRRDSETFRFTVSYSSFTHLLAIMNKIVTMLIGIYFVNKGKLSLKEDLLLLLEMICAEGLMIGTAMRGEIIMAPCVVFIFYAIKKKLSLKFYVIGGIAALVFIGVMPYVRMLTLYGSSYIISLRSISRYPDYYMFTPLYQTFSNNFQILNVDFSIFPEIKNFGYGMYAILPEIPFANLGTSLMDVQNEVLNNSFYSGLTATYLAEWYADFGYIGCFFSTILFAALTNYAYSRFERNHSVLSCVLYAYVFYSSLWVFYNSVFDFVFICYSLVIWFALKCKVRVIV